MNDMTVKSIDCDIRVTVDGEALGDVAAAIAAADRAEAAAGSLGWLVPNRVELAKLGSAMRAVYLMEEGRQGVFQWWSVNLSEAVAADTEQGVYVPPTGQDGSTGCWVRDYHGPLMISWFGAVPDRATDNSVAMQGMISLIKLIGGTVCFNSTVYGSVYRTGRILLQGVTDKRIGFYCDHNVWLEKKDTTTHFNLFDIYDCENISLGDLNFNMRLSENPAIYVGNDVDGNRIFTTDNIGYGLTIRNCSNVSHSGKIRVYDYLEAVLVYTSLTTDPPIYHDVSFDYLELIAYVQTDIVGHVLDGGWAVAGVIMVNMLHSGVRFIDVVGVLTNQPGFAIEFKLDCHDCWFGGYNVKQCHVAISALGTGGGGTLMDAKNCWFGSGIIDQCKVAISISHGEKVTFAHVRARHHPDLWPEHALGTPPWFIQITGPSNDVSIMCEIIDYDGGVNDEPPIFMGGDRNTVIVPVINNAVPKYATIAGGTSHCSIAVWQDVSLTVGADLASKFIDLSNDDSNNYYVGGGGFGWRQGGKGGVKIDVNELSVRDIDGLPGISGRGYLSLQSEHFTATGIQRVVPLTGSSFIIAGHVEQVILEPAGSIASCTVYFPAGGRGKMITITSTQNITTCSMSPNGGDAIVGAPAGLTANTPVRFRFLDDTTTWYRA